MIRRASGLLALFAALAVLHTWPLASNPGGLSRLDNDDTGLNVFVISWIAHIVPRDPLSVFHAPIFFPDRYALAYSEHMLVPSLMGAPLIWAGVPPVTVYNLLILVGFTLSGWTMALVVRQWTGSTLAGVTAGMLYAFNAHLLTRLVHLQALHMEFLPLALFGLDQVLSGASGNRETGTGSRQSGDGSRQSGTGSRELAVGRRQPAAGSQQPAVGGERGVSGSPQPVPVVGPLAAGVVLTLAFVLQALCSNYTLVFLAVALLVSAVVRGDEWLARGERRQLLALVTSAVVAAIVLAPFLWPYYVVSREQGLSRSIDEVALYSASWSDYLATGGRLHYAWWSHRWFEGRTPLFPGVVGLILTSATLMSSDARRDRRVRMAVAIGAVGLALSFGPGLPGYAWLHRHVPLFEGLRAAARWGLLFLTAVAILAAFAVREWERRWRDWSYWPAAAALLLGLVTLEALRAPLAFVGVPHVPALYDELRRQDDAVIVELPLFAGASVSENARYMVHSTRHFRPMVNGYSGFETETFRRRAERWRRFPEPDVLADMINVGVTHVVVDTRQLDASQVSAAAENATLVLVREDEGHRLYRLRR